MFRKTTYTVLSIFCLFLGMSILAISTNALMAQEDNNTQIVLNELNKDKLTNNFEELASIVKPSSTINYSKFKLKGTNEIKMFFSGLFMVYKNFISSQDGQACSFHPSCSVYAIQSIQKNGFFIGLLSGFDRLTRCNSLSPQKYEFDPESRLLKDPVK